MKEQRVDRIPEGIKVYDDQVNSVVIPKSQKAREQEIPKYLFYRNFLVFRGGHPSNSWQYLHLDFTKEHLTRSRLRY